MERSGGETLTTKCALESLYDVYCLRKPKSAAGDTSATLTLTYSEVVDELDSSRWSFAPYPRCDRSQLLQVHTYWVAVPKQGQTATPPPSHSTSSAENVPDGLTKEGVSLASGTPDAIDASSSEGVSSSADQERGRQKHPSPSPRFSCVVGVVWVRLSANTPQPHRHSSTLKGGSVSACRSASRVPVEGYLQVVLTHPEYRRQGLASWLLRSCLANPTAPGNVFASDADTGEPYPIQRWHLHTLMASPSDSATKRRGRYEEEKKATANVDLGKDDSAASGVKATLSMYRRLGFTERRYLYKYYAGEQDAVELVKQCV